MKPGESVHSSAHYRILYLDGIHFTVRHGTQTDSPIILTALAVDLEGNKDVLALRACAEEDKDGWSCLLQDIRTRGTTQMDLIVTDGHAWLLAAVSALFSATPRQRCVVHKQRNVLPQCHPSSGAQRGQCGMSRDFQAGKERGCTAQSGGF